MKYTLAAAAIVLPVAALAQGSKPLAELPMKQIMSEVIYPTSDAIFYVTSREPKSDADWAELQKKAAKLADAAKVMLLPSHRRDRGRWTKDAQVMIDASEAAVAAAKKKDLDGVAAVNDALYTSCVQCHQHYRPGYGKRSGARPA